MLWNASAIDGYAIEARDGRLGTVKDFLFDDVSWAIRWLVVDTGDWLPGRKVLLPVSTLGQPDREQRVFPVALSKGQVEGSPDIDTARPVSRQIEAEVYRHYGQDPAWGGGSHSIGETAAASSPSQVLAMVEPGNWAGAGTRSDPHLRSCAAVGSCHIQATDGEIGHVDDMLIDDGSWHLRYIAVDTANWWPGEKVLVSCASVKEIDWPERLIRLDIDRQKIEDSPKYDRSITVDGAYDEKFLTYYGIKWVAV